MKHAGTNRDQGLSRNKPRGKRKILVDNFIPSSGADHWLGTGVYFFEDGIGVSGRTCATEWATSSAWCNTEKKNTYSFLSVIEALIRIEKLWDLTTEDGLKSFNYGRSALLKKFRNRRPASKGFDNEVITFVGSRIQFDGIRAWFYIKTDPIDRIKKVNSGIPNTKVLCVTNPQKCISLDEMRTVVEQYVA